MAKYQITYSCGHQGEVALFGATKEREAKIKWYEQSAICPDCYRAQKEAESAKANADLVPLAGTEKQIAWAISLRAGLIRQIEGRFPTPSPKRDQLFALLQDAINEHPEAKWWIDNRADLARAISPIWQAKAKAAGLT